jgi:hypothetical protein
MFCGVQGKPIYLLGIGGGHESWDPTSYIGRNSAPETFFVRHCAPGILVDNQNTAQKNCGTVSRRRLPRGTQTPRAYTSTRISLPICTNRLLL